MNRRISRLPADGNVINFEDLKEQLERQKTVKKASSYHLDNEALFFRLKRKEINYKGFKSYLVRLSQCFIDNQAQTLKKRLKQQEFLM